MRDGLKLLILAGSAEARRLAEAAQTAGADVQAVMSEPPRGPNPMPVPCVLQDFEDVGQVAGQMVGFDAVLDASHGFDGRMSAIGHAAARQVGLPFLCYQRPGWDVEGQKGWARAPDVAQAMSLIHSKARVFSAAGWASLVDCAGFPGERLFLRQTSAHDRPAPYPFVELVFGEAPFTAQSEMALFADLRIDTLLARNLGGQASRPKVDAAARMGLQVILIDRPALPGGVDVVKDVDAALAWINAL